MLDGALIDVQTRGGGPAGPRAAVGAHLLVAFAHHVGGNTSASVTVAVPVDSLLDSVDGLVPLLSSLVATTVAESVQDCGAVAGNGGNTASPVLSPAMQLLAACQHILFRRCGGAPLEQHAATLCSHVGSVLPACMDILTVGAALVKSGDATPALVFHALKSSLLSVIAPPLLLKASPQVGVLSVSAAVLSNVQVREITAF